MFKRIKKTFFFSLIWKALFSVTLSTLLASSSIFILGKYTYDKYYEQKITIRHKQYKQAFSSVLSQLNKKETELGWLVPSMIKSTVPKKKVINEIKHLIHKNWFKIELESDIRSIYLFDTNSQLKGEWGEPSSEQEFLPIWLNNVINNEQPYSKIICSKNCFQYHALPFLHNGNFAGIFIFVSSISDIVIQMKEITGADIGILIQTNKLQQPILPLWSSRIASLTDYSKNHPLLLEFQNKFPDSISSKNDPFTFNDDEYDIFTIPFGEEPYQARLIIIDNISHELLEKQAAVDLYIFSSLSSIILSGILLFLFFVRPTAKLKKIINLLPLIAEKKYSEVRKSLPSLTPPRLLTDEIDILDSAAHNLLNTLSKLDFKIDQRNIHLLTRSKELQNERNFVSNILDTAQVIIIRLDKFGYILSINKFGEKLIGFDSNYLAEQRLFTDLIYDKGCYDSLQDVFPNLLNGKNKTHQNDCSLLSLQGKKLYISWFFTVIHNSDTHPEILVVGLDLTKRQAAENKLAWLADHDPLTGLFNRRRFETEFHRILREADRFNRTGALIFFDIDQFKYVNDSSGHQAGDLLLKKVSEKLATAVRKTDVIARFGGDEFVVLAPEINLKGAKELINKIFSLIMAVEITLEETLHKVSISAGLLIFPVQGYTEQDLMASVDIAMYKAKETGRGRWCLAALDGLNREEVRQRVNWKAKIEKALTEDRFTLYFQPIMRIKDNSISHYECLLRMIDEKGGIVPPGAYIHIAEQTGLISAIDKKVLEMAVKKQKQHVEQGINIVLSINLSGNSISNPEIFELCTRLFNDNKIKAEQFIIEVTETQVVSNLESANHFITQLTAIGGQFALDDFGVGFSSMNYLKQLPVQYLKIDGEFIKNLPNSREDRLFVKAINEIGRGMNIITIAEFVENDEILDVLSTIGVDYAQGIGIGKPMPYLEFHQNKILGGDGLET